MEVCKAVNLLTLPLFNIYRPDVAGELNVQINLLVIVLLRVKTQENISYSSKCLVCNSSVSIFQFTFLQAYIRVFFSHNNTSAASAPPNYKNQTRNHFFKHYLEITTNT